MLDENPYVNLDSTYHHPDIAPDTYDSEAVHYFDWKSEIAICVSHVPDSPVYDMTFTEFITHRNVGYKDDIKTARCYCRVEPIISTWLPQVAARHGMKSNRYVSTCLELGVALLHQKYHDSYSIITTIESNAFFSVIDEQTLDKMGQLKKQTIVLNTGAHSHKMYAPSLPEGIEGAIGSTSERLHMTKNDMSVLCLCIGMQKDSEETPLPWPYMVAVDKLVTRFERELSELTERTTILNKTISSK